MKKKELLKIIEKVIETDKVTKKSSKILTITTYETTNVTKDESMWFPNIEELKDEFEILKKEIKEVQVNLDKSREIIREIKKNCKHEIRIEYFGNYIDGYQCAICGKMFYPSLENSTNIDNFAYIECEGYEKEQILNIILEILKHKDDEEEIDLIAEFKKLKYPNCEIIYNAENIKDDLNTTDKKLKRIFKKRR